MHVPKQTAPEESTRVIRVHRNKPAGDGARAIRGHHIG